MVVNEHSETVRDFRDRVMQHLKVECGLVLMGGYPPRVLSSDDDTTMHAAGLQNNVI